MRQAIVPAGDAGRSQSVSILRGSETRWVARYRGSDRVERAKWFARRADAERFLHDREAAILEEGRRRGIVFDSLRQYVFGAGVHPPTILLGYAPASEATIRAGIAELGEVIRATRRS